MINLQWGTQKNGRIDTSLLIDVSGRGDYMEPTAAAQFKRMQAAIWRDVGFNLQPASGSSAYRPEAIQIDFFTERYTRVSYNTGLWWKGSYWTKKAGVATAAIPDTSNHGWARAIDLNISRYDTKAWAWMMAHAAEYGYSWATGKASGEDWHWESLTAPGTIVAGTASSILNEQGVLMALSDDEQTELLTKTRAVYDALFKTTPIAIDGRTTLPGGVLVNQSIERDALFQDTASGAPREGLVPGVNKLLDK